MKRLIKKFLSLILAATAIGVTIVGMILGYEMALAVLKLGYASGQGAKLVLAGLPSLCALASLPFWLTLRQFTA